MSGRIAQRESVEAAVLGSMALQDDAAEFALAELRGDEFALPELRVMFTAIRRMHERGIPVDAITTAEELQSRSELEAAGGVLGIAGILEAVPHSAHCRFYVQQLQTLHQRDELRRLCERLRARAEDPTSEPSDAINAGLSDLEALRAGTTNHSDLKTTTEALEQLDFRTGETKELVESGLSELDRMLFGGFRAGHLIVIGGRPGTGKSALMMQMILNAAMAHRPGMIASLEMTSGEIAERALKTMSRQRFEALPLQFTECAEFAKLQSFLRLAKRRNRIKVAALDYLQLIESPRERNTLRSEQIAQISRGLKRMAMDLQLPILLGSQLNRESEKRGRPSLADLRESGAIEQDADIVILLSGDAESDERELIVAKHRGGPCGIVRATFDRPKFKFSAEIWTGKM
jgi:replicative DNA helicase